MSIKVSQLSKEYDKVKALKNISFEVPKSQIVGFLGPNGAGKSTLMKILTTYLSPTSGSAEVNDFDIKTQFREVQKSIGYLPEHNPLYLNQYPKEYLNFKSQVYKVKKERIEEVIHMTGLQNELKKKIGELSKGYRQRVGLASALLHDPEVLLLDEPTTGLDPNQLVEIRGLIKSLGKDKTVLLSTHILQEVEAMCDRVLVINKGELVADELVSDRFDKQLSVKFSSDFDIKKLNQIPNISKFVESSDNNFILHFSKEENCEEAVFDFAVSQNLKIIQLSERQLNIENLFQEVTS